MSDTSQSLSHSRWNCKYHVVFVPQRRRKALFGDIRKALGPILHELARQKECRILEGHVMPDQVHRCIEIPPKPAVASVIGCLKGHSAIAIARQCSGRERNFSGEHFWARGYAVSTVGFALEQVRASIRDQEQADDQGRFERCIQDNDTHRGRPPLRRPHSSSHRLCRGCLTLLDLVAMQDEKGRSIKQRCWFTAGQHIVWFAAVGPEDSKTITVRYGEATADISVAK